MIGPPPAFTAVFILMAFPFLDVIGRMQCDSCNSTVWIDAATMSRFDLASDFHMAPPSVSDFVVH